VAVSAARFDGALIRLLLDLRRLHPGINGLHGNMAWRPEAAAPSRRPWLTGWVLGLQVQQESGAARHRAAKPPQGLRYASL